MARIRVGVLAKQLNIKVSEAMTRLRRLGADVKTNLSTVDEETAARLRSEPAVEQEGGLPAKKGSARATAPTGASHRVVAPTKTTAKAPAQPTPTRQPLPTAAAGTKPAHPAVPPKPATAQKTGPASGPSSTAPPGATRAPGLPPRPATPQPRGSMPPAVPNRPVAPGFKPATGGTIPRQPGTTGLRPTAVRTTSGVGAPRVASTPTLRPTGTAPGSGPKPAVSAARPPSTGAAHSRAPAVVSPSAPGQKPPVGARPSPGAAPHLRQVVPGQVVRRPVAAMPPRQAQGIAPIRRTESPAPSPPRQPPLRPRRFPRS